ncbi:hypothetical protein OROMI_027102 [Orobanche minor]
MKQGDEVVHYVSSYYQRDTYAKAYELPISRVPHRSTWPSELRSAE